MQIDFHHGTTYVIARYAGFDHPQAEIIAYYSLNTLMMPPTADL
jgi:hypothetical protein